MARTKKDNANNTINIKSLNVKSHIGSAKYVNDDWGTVAFVIPRNELQMRFEDIELQYNCIYFLIGFENNKEMIYVGQAKKRNNGGSVLKRLREHDDSTTEKYRDVWDWVIVVTNKNDTWGLDDLNALENAFYHEIPAEQNLNGNNPNSGGADYEVYIDKIKQIKNYITSIGFTVFADAEDTEKIQITSEVNEYTIVEDLQNGMARIPEIITPQKVVKAMVDMLPEEVWNSHTIFLDPACKGGEYLKEIYDRLMETESVIAEYPNQFERSNHILLNQLYDIALSQVSLERTTKKLLGCGTNIRVIPDYINKLKGINLGSRPDGSQNNILDILNKEFGKEMKFDVVIGNPPYQENSNGSQKTPLYHRFVNMGMELAANNLWIIPSRWFSGGIGLNDFRHKMLNSNRLDKIVHYKKSTDIFNGVDIAGGVCILSIEKEAESLTFIEGNTGKEIIIDKDMCKYGDEEILLDRCEAYSIVNKIKTTNRMTQLVKTLNYFGVDEKELSIVSVGDYTVPVICSYDNINYALYSELNNIKDIPKYKVITGKVNPDRGGVNNSVASNVINKPKILNPGSICSFSYMTVGIVDTLVEANNIQNYIKTKFVRFLLLITLSSMNISARNWMVVPLQDFTSASDIDWSKSVADIDQQLYKKYKLTQEEIDYIEATIKPM